MEKHGLQIDDIVVACDDQPVSAIEDLQTASKGKQKMEFTVIRIPSSEITDLAKTQKHLEKGLKVGVIAHAMSFLELQLACIWLIHMHGSTLYALRNATLVDATGCSQGQSYPAPTGGKSPRKRGLANLAPSYWFRRCIVGNAEVETCVDVSC